MTRSTVSRRAATLDPRLAQFEEGRGYLNDEPELFRACRQALGLSQAEIADALLVAAGRTVRRWEAGAIPIPGPPWVALRYMLGERGLPPVDDLGDGMASCDDQLGRRATCQNWGGGYSTCSAH